MERTSGYYAKFPPEIIQAATALLESRLPKGKKLSPYPGHRAIKVPGESWTFDSDPLFFQAYRSNECSAGTYSVYVDEWRLTVRFEQDRTFIDVRAPDASAIAAVFEIFDQAAEKHNIPRPTQEPAARPKIFIGHGGKSKEWMALQNHLREHHHYEVEAFESGARSGHTIRDILEAVSAKASFAILIFTGEDETASGTLRARQNVVHETGLFQGKLGFNRAIVLHEAGVELFSNLDGIQWIGFSKDNIREAYGDVLAVLRREFGDAR